MTNVEFVTELMEFSPYGALAQMFIIDAIAKHAKAVAQATPEKFESAMLSGEAWIGVAKDINAKLKAHYGPLKSEQSTQAVR
ncbi:hypothetical protein D8I35_03630 [Corticibacter populi]|uniref:Uncharacterized protein n=2 Tax=Corticibacter populi TaxID=1550736 RepID=A0A3M6QYX4_9BURK|nr:hypothetical protein [Corticibacter populi]RMX08214.1 hypothetical protein D8I35_03630 [Corticibacter populi]